MRCVVLSVVLGLLLTGCSGGVGDALQGVAPSSEVTSSVVRPGAGIPGAGSGEADAGYSGGGSMSALIAPEKAGAAPFERVAMRLPQKPAFRPSERRVYSQKFGDAHPINFGKVTPQHHAVHGVDVSRWQGEIDWATLKQQGANFAFIKATDGGDHLDPLFKKNWQGAAAAGIKRGAYHFFYWCRNGSEQADWFIRNVPKDPSALPPVIDVEWNHLSSCKRRPSREVVLEKMQVFMDRLERHYGKRPIIYTAPDFYRDNLKGAFPNHPFWLRSVAAHPSEVYPGRDWLFWQYSGSGLSRGVEGRIDLNVFKGDADAWWRWVERVSG